MYFPPRLNQCFTKEKIAIPLLLLASKSGLLFFLLVQSFHLDSFSRSSQNRLPLYLPRPVFRPNSLSQAFVIPTTRHVPVPE
jgi:hypothetical protein